MGVHTTEQDRICDRKEMIKRIRKVINDMDNSNVEARCCCTDPKRPPEGTKVVQAQVLDGKEAVPRLVTANKEKYIWIPPFMDTRQLLDHSHSCYSATVANQFYDSMEGCKLDCRRVSHLEGGAPAPHSHWWNAAAAPGGPSGSGGGAKDYCEDPDFIPPEPVGHQSWTNEPGGKCNHPQYCKAHCFEHSHPRDWARQY